MNLCSYGALSFQKDLEHLISDQNSHWTRKRDKNKNGNFNCSWEWNVPGCLKNTLGNVQSQYTTILGLDFFVCESCEILKVKFYMKWMDIENVVSPSLYKVHMYTYTHRTNQIDYQRLMHIVFLYIATHRLKKYDVTLKKERIFKVEIYVHNKTCSCFFPDKLKYHLWKQCL